MVKFLIIYLDILNLRILKSFTWENAILYHVKLESFKLKCPLLILLWIYMQMH